MDHYILGLQRWIRSHAILYRLTLGTRVLLAVGFIPTGLVKVLGQRFTTMSPTSDIGGFFETLYRSGPYWHFLGFAQMLAGLLVLWPATATVGAVLFFGIMLNVFVITLSYDFHYTPVVTGMMLLATLYLLAWDYDRLRPLFGFNRPTMEPLFEHRLSGLLERSIYAVGVLAGIPFAVGLRGLFPPGIWNLALLWACIISFLGAIALGLIHRNAKPALLASTAEGLSERNAARCASG
jgi:uncharacterized membrane protein YphA (DoxX/SURF4 family)